MLRRSEAVADLARVLKQHAPTRFAFAPLPPPISSPLPAASPPRSRPPSVAAARARCLVEPPFLFHPGVFLCVVPGAAPTLETFHTEFRIQVPTVHDSPDSIECTAI